MNRLSRLMYGLLLVALTGCNSGSDEPPVKSVAFGPYKHEVYTWFLGFSPVGGVWGGIEGFQWEWGYDYVVEYREYPMENPPQDHPGVRRVLERIVSKDRVPSDYAFTLALRASDPFGRPEDTYLSKLQDGLYRVFDTQIECYTPDTCGGLDNIIEEDLQFVAVFAFRQELTPPIVLTDILCTEPNDDHVVQCEMLALR